VILEEGTMSVRPIQAALEWKGGLQFLARSGDRELVLDGDAMQACSPMETLLMSLAGCMAIDIVHILGKMQARLGGVQARAEGRRAESDPRRFASIRLHFEVCGEDLERNDIDRVIALSREKYCSVYHSLHPEIQVDISCEVKPR
jgi:putative redox protein